MNLSILKKRVVHRAHTAARLLTTPWRTLPDFLIIGALKSGTTSLFNYLLEHPLMMPPRHKEVFFFDRYYQRGELWYRSNFPVVVPPAGSGLSGNRPFITGEATPHYLQHPRAPERVAKMLPHARLIALLRDPVDRTWSHYKHNARNGWETLPLEEALEREHERTAPIIARMRDDPGYYDRAGLMFSYLGKSTYADQLPAWWQIFPREQLLVLSADELFARPAEIYRQVLEFLRLPAHALTDFPAYNTAGTSRGLDPDMKTWLRDYFRPHNQRLYDLLGRDLHWDDPDRGRPSRAAP